MSPRKAQQEHVNAFNAPTRLPEHVRKLRAHEALTAEEVAYIEVKRVLNADEAAHRLGLRDRRHLVKELHRQGIVRADLTPPGSNRLTWSKAVIDETLDRWRLENEADMHHPEPRGAVLQLAKRKAKRGAV